MKSMELQQTIEDLKAGDRLALSKFLTHVETSDNPIELVLKLYNKAERTTVSYTHLTLPTIYSV